MEEDIIFLKEWRKIEQNIIQSYNFEKCCAMDTIIDVILIFLYTQPSDDDDDDNNNNNNNL
jgi:hypothetical protein